MYTRNEKIIPVSLEDEVKSSYIDYAMSVIVGRALPDVRDGLKPVHRRILYAMRELDLAHNKPYKKSARVVGEVLGKFHPHGDTAVYDAMVRMVQDFSLRYPLIDGQGNFGSVDGDSAAAMRYTEARLSPVTGEMLTDIERETVDFVPNFDETLQEPSVLPARLPNLLLNGSSGIAVGMATNIPPHNLNEVIDAIVMLIDDPEAPIKKLIADVKGPDFPTGGTICGKQGIKEAYHTGRGIIKVRAKASVEKSKNDKETIIISEIPYQVNKTSLLESMAQLVQDKRIEGISNIRDESDRDGMRIVIELKRDANSQIILNQLYKHTPLETTFGIIMLALVDNRPRVLNLKQMLLFYIEHRKTVIRRRTKFELKRAEKRAHILEGFKIALANIDKIIKLIKSSKTPQIAKESLIKEFSLSPQQAQAILELQLQRLTGLEQDKIEKEYLELIKKIELYRSILKNPKKVLTIIKEEALELKKKFGDERRTQIVAATEELEIEDLIAEEDMVITISHSGYIKRIPVSSYRKQHRGGRGVSAAGVREEDFIEQLFIASTHEYILFFSNKGKVYWLKVYEIPQGGRLSKGRAIVNLLSLASGESINALVPVKEFVEGKYLFMATRAGTVKKTTLTAFKNPRKAGLIAVTLEKDDELIGAELTDGNQEVLLATQAGKAIRFAENKVRNMGRAARGVKGINLGKHPNTLKDTSGHKQDTVVGMEIVHPKTTLLTITEKGFGKRTLFAQYRKQSRGGKGIINIKVTPKNGRVIGLTEVADEDEVMLITESGMIVRCPVGQVRSTARSAQGVKVISLKNKDRVTSIAKVVAKEE